MGAASCLAQRCPARDRRQAPECASLERAWLESPWKDAAVEEDVLPGDEAGMGRAQECAGRAELVGLAEAARRDRPDAVLQRLFEGDALLLRGDLVVGAQPIGVERARQHEVD